MSRLLTAIACLLLSGAALAREDQPLPDPIDVAVEVGIDATGRIVDARLATDVQDAIGERLLARVRAFEFTPAQRDGVAAPSRTTVWLALAFEPTDGEHVAIRIRDAYTAPRFVHAENPRYPVNALREKRGADLLLRVRYDARGRVQGATVERSGGAAFDKAALAVIRRWRLQPESVDGIPVPGTVLAPVSFRVFTGKREDLSAGVKEFADSARVTDDVAERRQATGDSVVALRTEVRDTLL